MKVIQENTNKAIPAVLLNLGVANNNRFAMPIVAIKAKIIRVKTAVVLKLITGIRLNK
ncbi:MAG: hypothetical protein R2836_01120 [Chitinophagales bacterium]